MPRVTSIAAIPARTWIGRRARPAGASAEPKPRHRRRHNHGEPSVDGLRGSRRITRKDCATPVRGPGDHPDKLPTHKGKAVVDLAAIEPGGEPSHGQCRDDEDHKDQRRDIRIAAAPGSTGAALGESGRRRSTACRHLRHRSGPTADGRLRRCTAGVGANRQPAFDHEPAERSLGPVTTSTKRATGWGRSEALIRPEAKSQSPGMAKAKPIMRPQRRCAYSHQKIPFNWVEGDVGWKLLELGSGLVVIEFLLAYGRHRAVGSRRGWRFHSVMESPNSVSRVIPPSTTMTKIMAATAVSSRATRADHGPRGGGERAMACVMCCRARAHRAGAFSPIGDKPASAA